jgi:thioredoxin reductase (NADPH)
VPSSEYDVAVIGGGVAGLNASIVAARNGARCVCFDKLSPGGQLINLGSLGPPSGLTEITTGPDLAAKLLETAMSTDVEFAYEEVTTVEPGTPCSVLTGSKRLTARTVVLATGLSNGRLEVAREDEFVGNGISHCANCDGPLFAGKPVAVVGNDDWAAQEALDLTISAEQVNLVVPDTALTCLPQQHRALKSQSNLTLFPGYHVVGLESDEDGLAALTIQTHEGDDKRLPARAVFPYVGRQANTNPVAHCVDQGDTGRVRADLELRTSSAGILVAGDVRTPPPGYLLAAAADGLQAGITALRRMT